MSVVIPSLRAAIAVPPWVKNELWRRARAVPSLDLRFADNKSLVDAVTGASLVTFTRASSKTVTNSAKVLETVGIDVPAFDHNPTTGESLGLLVEEQRSNLLLHNRTLTNVAWVASNITPAKDQVGTDDVSNSASSITATDANGTILQTITSASAARATSAYVKRITGTGTIEMTQNNGSTWTAVTVTSAWARVTIPSATVTDPVVGFRIATSGDAIAVDYAQLENGAFSTSAIGTTTAAVTRSADVASITGSAFSSWYSQSEGTVFADAVGIATSGNPCSFDINDGTTSNRQVYNWGASTITVQVGAAIQASLILTAPVANVFNKLGYGYSVNNFASTLNGGALATDVLGSIPVVNRLTVGDDANSSNFLNGTIRRLAFWGQRLPNNILQAITQ
jgi:hypothetical protein